MATLFLNFFFNAERLICNNPSFCYFLAFFGNRQGEIYYNFFYPYNSSGFKCFQAYLESVNIAEHKMVKVTTQGKESVIVEKQDLLGLQYLWQLVLDSPYPNIAEDATKYLINLSYTFLSPKLKKVFKSFF